ncbi:MAG: hypothetical protein JST39_18155, partial [Bacteroidetes bacterium]|nr:hypothetical protein [Bacteroidota bacterium]
YLSLQDKLSQPDYYPNIEFWHRQSILINHWADSERLYLDSLEDVLREQAGISGPDSAAHMEEEKPEVVELLFKGAGVAAALSRHMISYTEKMAVLLDTAALNFTRYTRDDILRDKANFLKKPFSWTNKGKSDSTINSYFRNNCVAGALAMLSKLKNDVSLQEDQLLTISGRNLGRVWICEWTMPLVNQNTNCLRAGQKLTLTAGIGRYEYNPKANLYFDGKKFKLNGDNVAEYTITASGRPGKYYVPFTIEFYNSDGKLVTISKKIEYSIIE